MIATFNYSMYLVTALEFSCLVLDDAINDSGKQ